MALLEYLVPFHCLPKTTDLGEKLDLPDVVFGRDELFQPAVIAGKGSGFGWWC